MTVCVYSEGVMAADSWLTVVNRVCSNSAQKIYENADTVIAVAGHFGHALQLVRWVLEDECDPALAPVFVDIPVDCIVVDKHTLEAYSYDCDSLELIPIDSPVAIGSGGDFALGALAKMKKDKAPLDAIEAVKLAITCDLYCGGKVKSINLNPKPTKKRSKPKKTVNNKNSK